MTRNNLRGLISIAVFIGASFVGKFSTGYLSIASLGLETYDLTAELVCYLGGVIAAGCYWVGSNNGRQDD